MLCHESSQVHALAVSPRLMYRLQVVAINGVAEKVSVVQRDAGLLERGKHVRRLGVNVVVADFFDAGGCETAAGMQFRAQSAGMGGGRAG